MSQLKDYLVIDAVNSIYNLGDEEYLHHSTNGNHYSWSKKLDGGFLGIFHQELTINTQERKFEIHFDVTREKVTNGDLTVETLVNAYHEFDDVSSMEKVLGEIATARVLELTEYH